jgi:hypothetical protein
MTGAATPFADAALTDGARRTSFGAGQVKCFKASAPSVDIFA